MIGLDIVMASCVRPRRALVFGRTLTFLEDHALPFRTGLMERERCFAARV
jgi:hypothetical protein